MRHQLEQATRDHIERSVEVLADEFAGIFSRETIDAYVEESLDQFAGAGSRSSSRCWSRGFPASVCAPSPRRRAR